MKGQRDTRPLHERRVRTCYSMHECCVCGKKITYGQRYCDGGYKYRAHVECAMRLQLKSGGAE